jgi:hypothetical protein
VRFSLGVRNKNREKIVVKRAQMHPSNDARNFLQVIVVLARNRSAHNSVVRSSTDQRFLTTLHFIFTRLFKAVSSGPRYVVLRPSDPPGDRQGTSLLHRRLHDGKEEKGQEEGREEEEVASW